MNKRQRGYTIIAIMLSIVAIITSALSIWSIFEITQSIPNQIHTESNTYLNKIRKEVKANLDSEEAIENTFNHTNKFSKFEGKVSELQYLYETGVLSEGKVRKQLKNIFLDVNSDPNLQYLPNRYYKDIDTKKSLDELFKSIIRTLNQEAKERLSFYKIRE